MKREFRKASLGSLLQDTEVVNSLHDELSGATPGAFESGGADGTGPKLLETVLKRRELSTGDLTALEAIVLKRGRPALLVQNQTFALPLNLTLRKRLQAAKAVLDRVIPSVGRVELHNHPDYDYVGTAWMIAEGVLITNRHVANTFAQRVGSTVVFRTTPGGKEPFRAQIDFRQEHKIAAAFEVPIEQVIYLEEDKDYLPDMALVRLKSVAGLPPPIAAYPKPPRFGQDVAAIGYPAHDTRNDSFVMNDIFENIYKVKRLSPGLISGVEDTGGVLNHDCTSLGGSSGSPIVDLATGQAVGLHFSGSYLENNYAVPIARVLDRLAKGNVITVPALPQTVAAAGTKPEVKPEEAPKPKSLNFHGRTGYDPEFLGESVPLPQPKSDVLTPVAGTADNVLRYLHYSVAMHKERRMALFTAVNIDGAKARDIVRTKDAWFYDARLPESAQIGEDLYAGNPLDRGHLVRRLDPSWGTDKEARQAIADTFVFTNCTPQHEGFNQRTWLSLEDYVLSHADDDNQKVCVFTGPVFRDTDKLYRGVKIPEEYWKVVSVMNKATGNLSVTGYVVSQADLISRLEFIYGAFRTYQVSIKEIEARTNLDFGDLSKFDPLGRVESQPVFVVRGAADLVL